MNRLSLVGIARHHSSACGMCAHVGPKLDDGDSVRTPINRLDPDDHDIDYFHASRMLPRKEWKNRNNQRNGVGLHQAIDRQKSRFLIGLAAQGRFSGTKKAPFGA
jgi:hypothetical protein